MSKWLLSVVALAVSLLLVQALSGVAQQPPANTFMDGEIQVGDVCVFVPTGDNYLGGTRGEVLAISKGWVKVKVRFEGPMGSTNSVWINLQNVGAIRTAGLEPSPFKPVM